MRNKKWLGLFLSILIPITAWTPSCTKTIATDISSPQMTESEATLESADESELEALQRQWSLEEGSLKEIASDQELQAAKEKFMEEDIYFNKESYTLLPAAQEILKRKAQWLKQNSEVSVIIQGHSDEPGSAEYNFAIGDRRAGNVKSYLIQLGIDPSRLTAVSFGKEQPIDAENNEEARARNRRVHFLIEN